MKKIINQLITVAIIATAVSHTTHCISPRKKNDDQASQLTQNIESKMERAQNAQTPEEQQRLAAELANDIEQATTYFDTMQNFFGYGSIAERRRAQAEKQKHILEHKLAQEEIRYKTATTAQAKEKSLEKQNHLKNKIHTEKIALGQAWSWQQKTLLGALAAATAYVGYQYGGTIASTAKEWWNGKTQDVSQPTTETPLTISEKFSSKLTQLKEQSKKLQQTATKKINTLLTPTVDQQAAQLAQKPISKRPKTLEQVTTDPDIIAMREYYGRRYDAERKRSPEASFDEVMTKILMEQKKDQELIKAQKTIQGLPLQQQQEYKQYLENLNSNEINKIPVTTKQIPTQVRNNASYRTEVNTALPERTASPEEQALQAQQYETYKKELNKSINRSMSWSQWFNSFFK